MPLAFGSAAADGGDGLRFHAWATLQTAFPPCPVEPIGPLKTQNRVAFERWYATHQGTFVGSRIVDGWVPGSRAR